jgi:hypothetical protein
MLRRLGYRVAKFQFRTALAYTDNKLAGGYLLVSYLLRTVCKEVVAEIGSMALNTCNSLFIGEAMKYNLYLDTWVIWSQ